MRKKLLSETVGHMLKPAAVARVTISLLFIFLLPYKSLSQANLVRDIVYMEDMWNIEYRYLIDGDGTFYFVETNNLWRSDGTVDGTVKVKAFNAISRPLWHDGALYFAADDGVRGLELWKSDGTTQGTVMIKDIRAGSGASSPEDFAVVNGTLFFAANDGVHGKEVWKSDGTSGGTAIVKDIIRGGGTSNAGWLTSANDLLFFSANDAQHGYELWKSDGTPAGTVMVKDLRAGASSSPVSLTAVNGRVFFIANDAAGKELWVSDGTGSGTYMVKDIKPGSGTSSIDNMTAVNDVLFFTANDGVHGHELWKSDGTAEGTMLVKDMTPGGGGSHGSGPFSHVMTGFKNINGTLFYAANQSNSYYIWKSDGTPEGTIALHPAEGPGIKNPLPQFTYMNGAIYFFNNIDEPYGQNYQLFRMNEDGSNPQPLIGISFYDYYNTYYPEIVNVGDHLYIAAQSGGGATLIKSDGTPEGTKEFLDVNDGTLGSYPDHLFTFNNNVYFDTELWPEYYHDDFDGGLWKTDGTSAGTQSVLEQLQEIKSAIAGDVLYIAAYEWNRYGLWKIDRQGNMNELAMFPYGEEVIDIVGIGNLVYLYTEYGDVWRSDGTPEGTYPLLQASSIRSFAARGNDLMVHLITDDGAEELWKSQGTVATTTRLVMIRPAIAGGTPSRYYPTAVVGDVLYFVADDGMWGNEIWRSSGTASGTNLAIQANNHDRVESDGKEFDIAAMASFKSRLYFSAREITSEGYDFWSLRSFNGTSTTSIPTSGPILSIIPDDDRLYLVLEKDDGAHELWTYEQGQPLLMLAPLDGKYYAGFDYEIIDGVMFYSASEGEALWRTDGTECGTFAVPTGTTGAYPMEAIGSTLIFASFTQEFGVEPYSLDLTTAPASPCAPQQEVCTASGNITREYWAGVQGSRVSDIPLSSPPTTTNMLTVFEGPTNIGSHYGTRIRGYICPPVTGTYHFYISSNDHSELWLSDGDDPVNKVRIAFVNGATGIRQWDKYSSQRSAAIQLTKGSKYYIEALHKQGVGSDHIAVGWELPDGTLERPIAGVRLSPFDGEANANLVENRASNEARYGQIAIYPNPASSGDAELTVSGYEGIEASVETQVEIANMTGEVVFTESVVCGGDCHGYVMRVGKVLAPGIYIVHLKTNGARFSKRLLVK